MPIEIGQPFPAFTLPDQRGKPVSLKSLLGKPVVLYIYPEADTPSCTKEACAFSEAAAALKMFDGATVVGLSPDAPATLAKFDAKYSLGFTLIGDEPVGGLKGTSGEGGVPTFIEKIGAWGEKSMYGKKYMGLIRTTYLLDAKGRVAARWDNVRVPGHDQQVLGALRALVNGEVTKPAAKKSARAAAKKVVKKAARTRGGK